MAEEEVKKVKTFWDRDSVKISDWGESRTKSEYAADLDRNEIMRKYEHFGVMPHELREQGFYADVSNIPNYQDSLIAVQNGKQAFMTLPARIRKRFGNDPQNLLDFLSDDNNYEEAVKLGIIKPDLSSSSQEDSPHDGGSVSSPTGGTEEGSEGPTA